MRALVTAGATLLLAALLLAGGWFARGWKVDSDALLIERAADKVDAKTATRIAGIRIVNQTNTGQVREIIRENTVYRECLVPDDMQRLLERAREGQPAIDRGGVPAIGEGAAP